MNGIHDLGGMHGMGPIQPEKSEPVFHARWEARVYAMARAMGAWRKWNIDASRHQRELIPPAEWLRMSYYEKWLAGLIELMIDKGLVTRAEVESGQASPASPKATPALPAEAVATLIAKGSPYNREVRVAPRFQPGQIVRARNMNPWVTRDCHATYAQSQARSTPSMVSSCFRTRTLTSRARTRSICIQCASPHVSCGARKTTPQDSVYVDLWDDYLEPA